MESKELSLNKTIIFNILSVVLIQGISFFTSPIFSRLLGTNNYGVYSAFNAWSSILGIILPLCVGSTIAVARNEFPTEEQHAYQSSILTVGIISTAVLSCVILLVGIFCPGLFGMDQKTRVILLVATFFSFVVNFANSRYTFELQANKNFVLALMNSLMTIVISLILVLSMPKETNYLGRVYGNIISAGILCIVVAFLIYRDGKTLLRKKYIMFCLPFSIPVIFHSLSNVILNQSDRIMLQNISTNSMVGVYSLAYNFTAIITAVYSAMNNSWIPFYYKYLRENDYKNLHMHANNYIKLYTLITVIFILVFKEVYQVFAGKEYWDGIGVIPVFVIGLYFMFLYSFAVNYEFYLKKTKTMAIITISAALMNLVLNYVFIKSSGIIGAAFATLISYLYEYIIHFVYVKKVSGGGYPFHFLFYLKPIIVLMIGVLIYILFSTVVIIRWGIAVIVTVYILHEMYRRKAIF